MGITLNILLGVNLMFEKLQLLLKFMKGKKRKYIGAVIFTGLSTLVSLVSPLVTRTTVDTIIGDQPMTLPDWIAVVIDSIGGKNVLVRNLWICGIVLLLLSILNGFFMYMRGKWTSEASEHVAKNIRDELFDHLQNLPYDEHVKAETGDWIQRCTSDVETIRRFLAMQLVEIGRTVLLLVIALSIMFALDVRMTLISMAVVPIIFTFSYVIVPQKARKYKQI